MAPARMTAWTAVARNFGDVASGTGREFLHHAHLHAALRHPRELDVVHEAAHEEDAAAARLENVFRGERIRDCLRLEALALVGDPHDELLGLLDWREREFD